MTCAPLFDFEDTEMVEEVILDKDRCQCLVNELTSLLAVSQVKEVKLRFDRDKIVLVPLCQPVEITR